MAVSIVPNTTNANNGYLIHRASNNITMKGSANNDNVYVALLYGRDAGGNGTYYPYFASLSSNDIAYVLISGYQDSGNISNSVTSSGLNFFIGQPSLYRSTGTTGEFFVERFNNMNTMLSAFAEALNASLKYSITYRLTNCTAPTAPTEAAIGDTVIVPFQFTSGYGIVNPSSDVYVTNNGVVVPSQYSNGVLTFTMPDPS